MNPSISFAVTAYEETSPERQHGQCILSCIQPAIEHHSISEIVIVDDASKDQIKLTDLLFDKPKVQLYYQQHNQSVFGNKLEAIYQAKSEWVITCDSDNLMDSIYLSIAANEINNASTDTWYCPSYAKPNFDYRDIIGTYTIQSIYNILNKPVSAYFINTGNQIVHRDSFLAIFERFRGRRFDLEMPNWLGDKIRHTEMHRQAWNGVDSFVFNWQWLLAGNHLKIVSGLEYDHAVTRGLGNFARAPKEKGLLSRQLIAQLKADAMRSVKSMLAK